MNLATITSRLISFVVIFTAVLWLVVFDLETWFIVNSESVNIPIFGFHNIIDLREYNDRTSEKSIYGLDYDIQNLGRFVDYLARHNYWLLTTEDLYTYFLDRSRPLPPQHLNQKPVMLTFDDGYKSVYTRILPLLKELENRYGKKLEVVLFVNPKQTRENQKGDRYATCEELREGLAQNLYDIQSHGYSHRRLTELNSRELEWELLAGQEQLRSCLNYGGDRPIASHLAYAYNDSNSTVEKRASQYYLSGYLYNHQMLKIGWQKDFYQIPRIRVDFNQTPEQLMQIASFASTLKSGRIFHPFKSRVNANLFLNFF